MIQVEHLLSVVKNVAVTRQRLGAGCLENMERSDIPPIAVAIFIIALVLVGEAIVISDSRDDFSSSIAVDGDDISFTINSHGSHIYTAVSLKGTLGTPETVSVYYDENYVSAASSGVASTGARALDENYYVEQIYDTLKVRGIDYSEVVDAEGLSKLMSGVGEGNAVIVISGSLPDTVYDGTSDSKVIDWIESGGRLYWIGGVLGKYISHKDSLETVTNGTTLFLGSECIDEVESRGYDLIDNGFRDALCIQSNHTTYGVDVSKLKDDTEYLTLGFTDGFRSSITTVKVGDGSICVLGGEYTIRQRIDLAQMVVTGIGPETELVDVAEGSVSGTQNGVLQKGDSVYIMLGGYFPVYGESHEVRE